MSEIKMIISDFDGIFTDNSIYIDEDGKIVPKMKISENPGKITNPHFKKVYRFYNKETILGTYAEAELWARQFGLRWE